jgi:hypothetical protein
MSVLSPIAVHLLSILAAATAVAILATLSGHKLIGTQDEE